MRLFTFTFEMCRALGRAGGWAAAAVVSLAVVVPTAALGGQRLHGHVPAAVAALRPVDRPPAAQRLHLAIGLPSRDPAGLKNLIDDLYNPASPNFRHYLTPAEFTAQFGPTEPDYQAVVDFAKANGLTVTGTHPNRLVLDVDGAIPDIESAFHVTLHHYQHPREGRKFYAPDAEPTLDLAIPVLHISGLDNYSLPHPNHKIKPLNTTASATPNAGSGPGGAYAGGDFRAAYVPGTALTGTGQSVALLQFDGYYASDISAYKTQFGLPDVPLVNVPISGGVSTPGTGNGEVCLDIEMVLSMAPGVSTIYVYEAPNPTPWVTLLSKMANDNLAKQISCSWGGGSPDSSSETIFQQMATQGQSFFNATGDSDALTGSVPFPSDSPNITEVGATTLTTTGAGGSYVSEKVWNWGLQGSSYVGSSGGSSTYYAITSWQQATSMATNQGSTTQRNLPDVALTGDNVYVLYSNGSSGAFGGTSCAAPLWAGFTALVNQQAVANGRASVGFLNPTLYALGNGASYSSTFHDTTTGNNFSSTSPAKFSAVAGYDLCTGWGTPNGTALINALAGTPEYLQVSMPAFAASGLVGGPFSPLTVSCTLTNSGTAALSWIAAKTQTWTSLSANSGTLAAGANTTLTWSLNNSASTLAAGTFADTVTFTDVGTGLGQSQSLSLLITGPPTNLVATPGNNAAKLTWTAAGAATTYNVKRSLVSGGPYTTVGTSATTSYTDATLTNGTTYHYVVSATNGSVESANSGEASVIPAPLVSTTTLASSLGSTGAYGAVTFSATVTGSGAIATGALTFKDGSNVLGTATLNGSGVATFTTSTLAVGSHALSASFPGDATYAASISAGFGYTVSPKPVTIITVAAANKVYDGSTSAVLTGGAVSGTVNSETVTVVPGSGSFASANAGTQAITATGYALSGTYQGNYVLSAQPSVVSATITPRPVVLPGTRVYDGTLAAGSLTATNNIDGSNLTVTGAGNLVSKDVGVQSLLATVPSPAVRVQSATASATSRATSLSVPLPTTPVSGNTLVAVISTHGTTANTVSGITQTGASWSRAAQAANSSNTTIEIWYAPNVAGAAKAITISLASSLRSAAVVMEYSGVLSANSLDQSASATGNSASPITGTTATTLQANELWIGGIGYASSTPTLGTPLNNFTAVANAQSGSGNANSNAKVYALERLTNPGGSASSGGTLSASVAWSGSIATFKTLSTSSLALGGSAAGNYTLTGASGAVTITPKALTLTGLTANNRTYDGTTTATLTGNAALQTAEVAGAGTSSDGLPYTGDTVSVGGAAAAVFADKHAAFGKPVTVTGYTLAGAQAGNYSLTQATGLSASIAPLPITVAAVSASKTYDGSPTAAGLPTLNPPLASGDTSSVLAQAFQDSNAAIHKTIIPIVTINDGNGGANYGVTQVNDNTGTIIPAGATIDLAGLLPTYDGTPKSAGATTTPPGLTVVLTYDGSATAPTIAGSYAVVATVSDTNYQGTASGNLVIGKASAAVALNSLTQTYDGTPESAGATTTPPGLTVVLTYDGSATAPTIAGSYAVAATVSEANYQGAASGNLVIGKASATVALNSLAPTYDGAPKPAGASTTPTGLTVVLTYDGSATAPTSAGSYAVAATVNDTNYQGAASGTLAIRPATDLATWRNAHFSAAEQSAGLAADDADPDGDALSNLAEYALGSDPRAFSPLPVPVRDANGLSITFTRPANLLDVSYAAECSYNLIQWSPVPLEVLEFGPIETVRASDPLTTGDPSRHLLRLKFERLTLQTAP